MKKIFNKKTLIYFLAFIIPILIIWGYIGVREIISGGTFFKRGQSFLVVDMQNQYNPLYNYFHNVLAGKDSIFYSFHNSLGSNMASTIGYYLSSPFNLLYGLVRRADIPMMTAIIYSLKIALCSLFMNIYIGHKFGNGYSNLIFSLTYAFMGFTTVYYFNAMWLDVIYMTPLVIMGIDKLIDGKPLMYIITLCLSIIFNFYIAYMLCIFCVIYFFYEIFIRYSIKDFKSYKKIILRFIISSLLAGGLSAFFLVPILLNLSEMLKYPISNYQFDFTLKSSLRYFIQDILPKFFAGSHNSSQILGRQRPVLYISLFSLILSYLYFFNKKIQRKEKVLSLIIIIFFILSFLIPHLQLFWQISFPNGYIDRYSFLLCFFLILLATKCFYKMQDIRIIKFIYILTITILLAMYIITQRVILMYIPKNSVLLSLIFIFVYCIFLKILIKKYFLALFILFPIIFVEIIYNYSVSFVPQNNYENDYYKNICSKLHISDKHFNRIELVDYVNSFNDSYVCNYYSVKTALTTNNFKIHNFMHKFGGSQAYTFSTYDASVTPVLPSLLSTKYVFQIINDNAFYNKIDSFLVKSHLTNNENSKMIKYTNPYALSLGFAIDKNYEKIYRKWNGTPLDNLNNLIKAFTNDNKNIFVPINRKKIDKLNYIYYINNRDRYIFFSNEYVETKNASYYTYVYLNDENVLRLESFNIGINRLNNNYYNENVQLSLDDDYLIDYFNLYYFDENVFKEGINKLKEHELKNIKLDKNRLTGEIDLDEDSLVFLSIPYDKGWKVYIDGKKSSYKEIVDTFMGIEVPKGKHKISIKFYPRGISLGVFISIVSIIGIIILQRKEVYCVKKNKRKNSK